MNADDLRALTNLACRIAETSIPQLHIDPDTVRTITINGTGEQLTLDITWLADTGERSLRMGCPR